MDREEGKIHLYEGNSLHLGGFARMGTATCWATGEEERKDEMAGENPDFFVLFIFPPSFS